MSNVDSFWGVWACVAEAACDCYLPPTPEIFFVLCWKHCLAWLVHDSLVWYGHVNEVPMAQDT